MHTYQQWCEHYGYDIDSAEAKADYDRYRTELEVFLGVDQGQGVGAARSVARTRPLDAEERPKRSGPGCGF